jgi:hypothetical protein
MAFKEEDFMKRDNHDTYLNEDLIKSEHTKQYLDAFILKISSELKEFLIEECNKDKDRLPEYLFNEIIKKIDGMSINQFNDIEFYLRNKIYAYICKLNVHDQDSMCGLTYDLRDNKNKE